MDSSAADIRIIRDLAHRYVEVAAKPIQDERRDLWRRHNSLQRTRPLVYCRWFATWNEHPWSKLVCEDAFWQGHERFLKQMLAQDETGDDYIIEPWITQRAAVKFPEGGVWGVPIQRISSGVAGGAWKYDPPLKTLDDIERLAEPHHIIDEEATRLNVERLQDAVGDIIEVNVDRSPAYTIWHADISTDIAYLRELGQLMLDMIDNPEWLHRLLAHMSEGILRAQDEAEVAGDWSLSAHQNQAMPYALALDDPVANSGPVTRDKLWCFCAAQEYALVSPAMHDEFLFQYQIPILEKFGLVSYGCCEDLTRKIDMLRQLPNLRRIAITPWADVACCAEQIGEDYVMSWRPNPAQMGCAGFDEDLIRTITRDALDASRGCHVDITLKDVQTVEGDISRLRRWVEITREIADEY